MSWPAKACGRRGIGARRAAAVLIAASADWHALTATAGALRNLRRVRLRSPGSLGPAASWCGAAVAWSALRGLVLRLRRCWRSREHRRRTAAAGARVQPRAQAGLHAGYSAQASLCASLPACSVRRPCLRSPGFCLRPPGRGRAGPHSWLLAPPPHLPPRATNAALGPIRPPRGGAPPRAVRLQRRAVWLRWSACGRASPSGPSSAPAAPAGQDLRRRRFGGALAACWGSSGVSGLRALIQSYSV